MALMKKLTSAIVASSLVLGLAGAAGATTPDKVQTAADRMLKLHMIKGVTPGSTELNLSANLTRAELMTVLVRAFGQESSAKYLEGAAAFPDTASHWGSGYIALAKKIIADRTAGKEVVGMPDGTFNPNGNVTNAEAVAFLMKFVGAPKDDSLAWPDNYISGAATVGIITAEDKAMLLGSKNDKATRGLAFYLADRTFYGYKLVEGGTAYTTFADSVKPTVTVDATPTTTLKDKIDITGTVPADVVTVHVNTMDNVATVANGKFTASVDLKVGENTILVHAVDLAGNQGEQTVKVTRTVGAADKIDVADITVVAGQAVDVKAVVKDVNGNAIKDAVVTGESSIGAFKDGKFTAGKVAGEGKLTLKSGELTKDVKVTVTAGALAKVATDKLSAAPGEIVTVTAQDENGNAISGATFSQPSADAMLDGATGKFLASKAGTYTVTAKVGDKTAEGKIGVYGIVSKVVVSTDSTIIANDASEATVTAKVVDANGNVVTNYDQGVTITANPAALVASVDSLTATPINGVATFKVKTAGAPAGQIIKISASTTKNGTAYIGDTTVQAVAQVATSVKFSKAPQYVAANTTNGNTADFAVAVVDQAGKNMLTGTGAWAVNLKVTGPATLQGNAKTEETIYYTAGNPAAETLVATTGVTGAVTVAATVDGVGTASLPVSSVIATAAASIKVSVDSTTTDTGVANSNPALKVNVQVVDKNGVPVAAPAGTSLKVYTDVDSTATKMGYLTINDAAAGNASLKNQAGAITLSSTGAGSFTVSSTSLTGPLNLTVKDTSSNGLGQGVATLKFKADKATKIAFGKTAVYVPGSKTDFVSTVQLTDASGNNVAQSGVEITVNATNTASYKATINGAENIGKAVTDANGVATFNITVPAYIGEVFNFAASGSINGAALTQVAGATATVKNTVATSVNVGVYNATTNAQVFSNSADQDVKLKVQVKDQFGNAINYGATLQADGTTLKLDTLDGTNITVQPSWTYDAPTGTYTSSSFKVTKAGAFAVKVNDMTAAAVVSGQANLSVTAGTVAKAVVIQASSTGVLTVANGAVSGPFTLQLADQFGNAQVTTADVTVNLALREAASLAAGKYFILRDSADGSTITSVTFKAGSSSKSFYVLTNSTNNGATTPVDLHLDITGAGAGTQTYTFSF